MKLTIDQIALCPKNPEAAIALLSEMGAQAWVRDQVVATGTVFCQPATNAADLAYNYELGAPKEFEVLHYTEGRNWVEDQPRNGSVSHFGMHCDAAELEKWRKFFAARGIGVVQELDTLHHTNPAIAGKRSYHYCIFGTRDILGVDLKFIVRRVLEA